MGVKVIVVEACVLSPVPNSEGLIKGFRSQFSGPIIVTASSEAHTATMLGAGATEFVERQAVADRVRQFLLEGGSGAGVPARLTPSPPSYHDAAELKEE